MAELHVQRKRNSFLWLWIFLLLVAIAAGVYLFLHYKDPKAYPVPGKSTSSIKLVTVSAPKIIQA
jgi:hypothetical protein